MGETIEDNPMRCAPQEIALFPILAHLHAANFSSRYS